MLKLEKYSSSQGKFDSEGLCWNTYTHSRWCVYVFSVFIFIRTHVICVCSLSDCICCVKRKRVSVCV